MFRPSVSPSQFVLRRSLSPPSLVKVRVVPDVQSRTRDRPHESRLLPSRAETVLRVHLSRELPHPVTPRVVRSPARPCSRGPEELPEITLSMTVYQCLPPGRHSVGCLPRSHRRLACHPTKSTQDPLSVQQVSLPFTHRPGVCAYGGAEPRVADLLHGTPCPLLSASLSSVRLLPGPRTP